MVQHQNNRRDQARLKQLRSFLGLVVVNIYVTKLDDQTGKVSSCWKGLQKTFTNLRKGLKVTRWNSVKTNAKGFKFDNRINHTNTAGQAGDLSIMAGQKLNIND